MRFLHAREEPGREQSEMRLVAHGRDDAFVTVTLEPLDEFGRRRIGHERLRRLDASKLEGIGDDLRRLPSAYQWTRRQNVDRVDRASQALGVQHHLLTAFVGERAIVIVAAGVRPDLSVFSYPVADDEQSHAGTWWRHADWAIPRANRMFPLSPDR